MATTKMRAVTSADAKAWDEAATDVRLAFHELAIAADTVGGLITDINDKIEVAATLVREIVDEAQGELEERSERWQEGEAGQEYQSWIEQLTALADQIEQIDEWDPPEAPDWLDEDLPDQA